MYKRQAIAKANALNKYNYKDFSAVETAINSVVRGKKLAEQADEMCIRDRFTSFDAVAIDQACADACLAATPITLKTALLRPVFPRNI